MKRLALAGVVAALVGAGTAAANAPAWTAQGKITALHKHSITVHGRSCRLQGTFGELVFYRWTAGDGAKIACSYGVLRKIAVLPLPSIIAISPAPAPRPPTGSGVTAVSFTAQGSMTVSALTAESITVVAAINGSSYTCTIGSSSPDLSGLQVGDRITRIGCQSNLLTTLVRA